MKLSKNQIETIKVLRQYQNNIVMSDGWLTGGHGVKLNLATVSSLKKKKLIENWGERRNRISELGKTCALEG
jgi:uncharacterized protein YjhX (UPF0386 family)